MSVGPIQLIAIGFAEMDAQGKVLPALMSAQEAGAIRVVDLQFVGKGDDGSITSMEMSGLSPDEQIEFGATVGALIGAGEGGAEGAEIGALEGALAAASHSYGLTLEDVQSVADRLPAGGAAAILLVEHTWATPFRDAVVEAGGEMLAQGFLTRNALILIGAEVEAQAEAIAAIEASEMIQAEAAYRAAYAVALSEAIQDEAAARAITALVAAELIEEAAIDEATQVVTAAYIIEEEALDRAEAALELAEEAES